MEFICVFSVGGSLASYHVEKESEMAYKAILRTNNGNRDDVPAKIALQKTSEGWRAEPWHNEVVQNIIHTIEANGQ